MKKNSGSFPGGSAFPLESSNDKRYVRPKLLGSGLLRPVRLCLGNFHYYPSEEKCVYYMRLIAYSLARWLPHLFFLSLYGRR